MTADVDTFEDERPGLQRLAYGILGSTADAEDVVQETWLRWRRSAPDDLRTPAAWLTRVCSRLALDRLRRVRTRREEYVGPWLPEPLLDEVGGPHDHAQIDESVSVALLVLLERLSPSERAAFLLHDVFGHDFEEVGAILGKTGAACRKLASRARAHLAEHRPRRAPDLDEHLALLDAFRDAATRGDADGLHAILAPDVVFRSDSGGKAPAAPEPLHGVEEVVRFLTGIARQLGAAALERCWFNGAPGWLVRDGGRVVTAFAFALRDGAIAGIYAHRNPEKLAAFEAR